MANWSYISGGIRTAVVSSPWSQYSSKITGIEMEDGIVLGERAFQGLTALASFTFPTGVTEIPKYTFADCISLGNVTIPDTVTSIGRSCIPSLR